MKKFVYILVFALVGIMLGCSSQNSPDFFKSYGTIQCVNNTSDPYTVTIKGNTPLKFTLEGNHYVTKSVEVGYYSVHVKQQSGYIFYATEKDYSFYVNANENHLVSF